MLSQDLFLETILIMLDNKVLIIAEAGVNHNGDINLAKQMIESAKEFGADIVKFQCYITENLVTQKTPTAYYQKKNVSINSQYEMLKKYELSEIDHYELKSFCEKLKIEYLSSPFDLDSLFLLKKLKTKKIKIPSGEITNIPLLREIGKLNKTTFLSTGMSTLAEINMALENLTSSGLKRDKIILLHCNTEYPTPFEDVNLRVINELSKIFNLQVGYSDHTIGIEVPISAVALGAKVIEKHFTLNREFIGPDHKASIEPKDFKNLINKIRNVEKSLGDKQKKPTNSEIKNLSIVRKSIVASKIIKKGEFLTKKNLTVKRVGNGLCSSLWDKVIGKKAKKNYFKDDLIKL